MEVWVCHQIFTAYTQWPCCSAPGSLWKMPDSNPGPLAPQLGALTISHHKPPPPHFTAEICFNKIHQCYINVSEKPCSVGPISFCFRTCVSAITPGIILKRLGGPHCLCHLLSHKKCCPIFTTYAYIVDNNWERISFFFYFLRWNLIYFGNHL